MSASRTHTNKIVRDTQAGNLYIASLTQSLAHIKFHFLSLFSKPGDRHTDWNNMH